MPKSFPDGLVPAVAEVLRTNVTFFTAARAPPPLDEGRDERHRLDIVSVAADCDNDTPLIRVIPHGPTCHTGSKSCFRAALPGNGRVHPLPAKRHPRHAEMPEGSYTSKLFTRGVNKIAQKVGEEAVETVIEAGRRTARR